MGSHPDLSIYIGFFFKVDEIDYFVFCSHALKKNLLNFFVILMLFVPLAWGPYSSKTCDLKLYLPQKTLRKNNHNKHIS
jgi:hypothetical protein